MTKHYHNKKYTDDNESLDHSSYKDDDSRLDSEQGDEVAKLEAKHVQNVKLGVFVVLAISMIGDITVYFTSRNTEERQFKEQFYDDAQKVTCRRGKKKFNMLKVKSCCLMCFRLVYIAGTWINW